MHVRLAAVLATLFVAGCASRSQGPSQGMRTAEDHKRAKASVINTSELHVRINQDLGPAASPAKDTFTARVVAPVVGSNGRVLVPVGSLVWGHVVHVDEPNRRVEITFDRLETRGQVYRLSASVATAQPFAETVAPSGVATSDTVVLQGVAPSAIGGGPTPQESEPADENAPRGDVIVPFDSALTLKVNAPIVSTEANLIGR